MKFIKEFLLTLLSLVISGGVLAIPALIIKATTGSEKLVTIYLLALFVLFAVRKAYKRMKQDNNEAV
jgi:predicted membrane channel-forming protein YqfA (hemolysin III family)